MPSLKTPWRLLSSALLTMMFSCAMPGSTAAAAPDQPAVMHGQHYRDSIDPRDYWVSEKLDGVRAVWDGHTLRFRSGRLIVAPQWFVALLPAQALDGELWMGRRSFDRLSGLVRREAPEHPDWREVRYMLFDLPGAEGDFSSRVVRMRAMVAEANTPHLQAVQQFRVSGQDELKRRFDEVIASGGEGLMLHHANAHWQPGRSPAILKLTPALDAEARVIKHLPGKGRLTGMTGSLLVETPDGLRFRLGSGLTDALRANPPPVGSWVTYRYRELTPNGLPRFPRFVRERHLP